MLADMQERLWGTVVGSRAKYALNFLCLKYHNVGGQTQGKLDCSCEHKNPHKPLGSSLPYTSLT